ncbi:MAG: site-specific DNA-methyltransferase [Dehalococcoidia bacterium]|jgi:site-specific DNA-methyltransferase (adenine-specific)
MQIETNFIYCGDCLEGLKRIPRDSVHLIYIDPPFNSNREHRAQGNQSVKRSFKDKFEDINSYLDYMRPRLKEMYRILKPTGCFFYHCDWHASHYIKVLLDAPDLFGYDNFLNEIVWCYKSGGASPGKRFSRKHDIILFYAKTRAYCFNRLQEKSYNRERKAYKFKGIQEYRDDEGWYTLVGMKDYWEINMVGRTSRERLDYPTQKPLALLERIIGAGSNEGDIVLDAFCGCGTTLSAAQKSGRRWIGMDISPAACELSAVRIQNSFGLKAGREFSVKGLTRKVKGKSKVG